MLASHVHLLDTSGLWCLLCEDSGHKHGSQVMELGRLLGVLTDYLDTVVS